jgi:alpha-ketoglutarate-dependent taurine dioxygenase
MIEVRITSSTYPMYEATAAHSYRDAVGYLRDREREIWAELHRRGAVLLRGFSLEGARDVQDTVRLFAPKLAGYAGGDSPRAVVSDKLYTSTSYPAALPISLHNEMSYTSEYPELIAFYCEVAPGTGGETPLADCRAVLAGLSPELVERLRAKRIRYVQNLHAGAGLGKSWQATFETTERASVEALLRERGAAFEWKPDGALRVAETVDAIVTHVTGARVFFGQPHLWHVSSLDPRTRAALEKLVPEDAMYHACSYGDGTPFRDSELAEIRGAFEAATTVFPWRARDLLLVDNVLTAHGRRPFTGDRRILVAMGSR